MSYLLSDVLLASDRIEVAGYEVERVRLWPRDDKHTLLELVTDSEDVTAVFVYDQLVNLGEGSEFLVEVVRAEGAEAEHLSDGEHWISCSAYSSVTDEVVCTRRGLR